MFDAFGEFDTVEELNLAADGQRSQGDNEALKTLALENGIELDYVQAFIDGAIIDLATPMTAAIGKLDIELKSESSPDLKASMEAMGKYLQAHCTEESLARAIRKKGKRLSEVMMEIRNEAEKRITRRSGTVIITIPPAEVYQMLRQYYMR